MYLVKSVSEFCASHTVKSKLKKADERSYVWIILFYAKKSNDKEYDIWHLYTFNFFMQSIFFLAESSADLRDTACRKQGHV